MRVLLLIPGSLGERVSAPEVRGWNMALELGRHHEVIVAAPTTERRERDGIPIIPSDRGDVLRTARAMDAVVAPRIPPYLYAGLSSARTLLVADMYNPAEVEQDLGDGVSARLRISAIRANDAVQLRYADVVLCAVDAQRRRLAQQIDDLGGAAGTLPILRVVPFGIDNAPPPAPGRRPIRDRFGSIADADSIVLWWGNVWRWFDADTALEAFALVAEENPRVKLIFTGGRPPRSEASEMDRTDQAREKAEALGLLGTSVFFVDDWIPHAERHEYLQEADIGFTLHRDTPEKEVAARGRYMDYLWARLPCVLGAGDELAERFAGGGFATTVPAGDVAAAKAALKRFLDYPEARQTARQAADQLLETFRWSHAVRPLLDALDEVQNGDPLRTRDRRGLIRGLGAYYARKAALALAMRAGL